MNASDTIFALSTGALPSGVAVIRLSGPAARGIVERMLGRLPAPRSLTYGPIHIDDEILDHGMAVWFPGPRSATGEDCAELHLHGSVAVVKAATAWLAGQTGLRLAEPGEFTLRGFHSGRLDLTGVEALSDLIAAETDAQRRQALGGVEGRIRDECVRWRAKIQSFRASIEAELDFSDQEDVPDRDHSERQLGISSLVGQMRALRGRLEAAEIVRRGFRVAIIGAPNAGKSSLINALAMRDVAIVTPEPGTTRDLVETTLDLGGYKVLVTDTAGIRKGQSEAEKIGIARARQSAETADLVLLVSAPDVAPVEVATDGEVIRLGTKADLGRVPRVDVSISVKSGEGIRELVQLIGSRAAAGSVGAAGLPLRERHVGCIDRAMEELEAAMAESRTELTAEHLRLAAMEIGRIVGIGDTETLLGEIFSRFCIGK